MISVEGVKGVRRLLRGAVRLAELWGWREAAIRLGSLRREGKESQGKRLVLDYFRE